MNACRISVIASAVFALSAPASCPAAGRVLDPATHVLRSGAAREWDDFPERAEGPRLVVSFPASANESPLTLRLRQRDVKQAWAVTLNGKSLGPLVQDESEIVTFLPVPARALREGMNELKVACAAGVPSDDVKVGAVELIDAPRERVLAEGGLAVEVSDADSGAGLPCRITVADAGGGLMTMGTASAPTLAVRPGVAYSADGRARLALPAGRYTVYAGRGFEYTLASADVEVRPGESAPVRLTIRRVVPTGGYAACDTHVHTLTHSGHGDATVDERMLTLAGEGVELPVAAEHNLQVDYAAPAGKMRVRQYFTPVVGNEVTTPSLGHFNVFPVAAGAKVIDFKGRDWAEIGRHIGEAAPGAVVVLNHARDVHGNFAPFAPARHVSLTGEQLDGVDAPANAMEVINSGATRADATALVRDWFGMLNRGRRLTPVGASDSHDVSRYVVGQARTYVRCDDADPGRIDLSRAKANFLAGRVTVSYGLMVEMTVDDRFGPGDLVPASGDLKVSLRVLGPEWTRAWRVVLYVNGVPARDEDVGSPEGRPEPAGEKWRGTWTLPRPKHDVFLAAVATGPGVTGPYWPAARPYQPTTTKWEPYVLAVSGAVWVDADGSGKFESAHEYGTRAVEFAGADVRALARELDRFDEAVAAQALSVLRGRSKDAREFTSRCRALSEAGSESTRRGAEAYLAQWKQGGAKNTTD